DRPDEQATWIARELLSAQELVDNGRHLRHCVATYAASCIKGTCSIWSIERRDGLEQRADPQLTVEIDANGVMMQARGRANRWPTEQEKTVLGAWMRHAGLTGGPYLYGF